MVDTSELTGLVSALRAETERDSLSPERVGYILQKIIDALPDSAVKVNGVRGWVSIASTDDLPETPTTEERGMGYLLGTVLYVYVGTGGDTLDGLYQSAQLKGQKGDTGNTVQLGEAVIADNLTTDDAEKVLSAKQGKVLKGLIDNIEIPVVNDLTTGGEGNALSAEQGKILGSEVFGGNSLPDETAAYITSQGLWTTNDSPISYVVPIQSTDVIVMAKNASYSKVRYAFLKTFTAGTPPTSTFATGYAKFAELSATTETTIDVPSDANYLYFQKQQTKSGVTTMYLPAVLKINGTDILADAPSLSERIDALGDEVYALEDDFAIIPSVTLPTSGITQYDLDTFTSGGKSYKISYYRTTASCVVGINFPVSNFPVKVSMMCRVASSGVTITAKHKDFGSSTNPLFDNHGYYFDNTNWELKEIILPIGLIGGTIELTIPSGFDFRSIEAELYEFPQRTVISKLLHAHLGTQFGRNTLMSFTASAKYGFCHCISNVQRTSDGVLVCAHDNNFKDNNGNSKNISDYTYAQIEAMGYNEDNSKTTSNRYWLLISDHHLCTVEEFLQVCARASMLPEFSVHNDHADTPADLYELCQTYGFEKNCIIKAASTQMLTTFHALFGDRITYVLNLAATSANVNAFDSAFTGGRKIVEVTSTSSALPTSSEVELVLGKGMEFGCFDYSGSTTQWYKEAMALGVTYFTTDVMLSVGVNF